MDAHTLECLDFARVRELLAEHASCALGRALAMRIEPVGRIELIRRWHAQVRELQRLADDRGLPPFGGIRDVRETVERCAPPLQVTAEDLAAVCETLSGAAAVSRYLRDLPDDFTELRRLSERVGDFTTLAEKIRGVIDERGRVRDEASPKLARVRGEIAQTRRSIRESVERLLQRPDVRRLLQFPNYTFVNDRIVLPLRTECRGRLPGIIHSGSGSGATLFVEPSEAVELNNRIADLRSQETEEITRLLWALAHEVYVNAKPIIATLDALAVLDLDVAKVRFAKAFDARCPEMCEDAVLSVRAARHPLLVDLHRRRVEQGESPEPVVPIDFRIGDDFDLLIITGPNTGGKTIALKTIGLLLLMAQSGLPVPAAEGSRFGVFKRVLIDIGDEQSMQQSLSTFSAHLTRQLDMLQKAGPRNLVLIDELGAGTDPDEGAAIGMAILDELLRLECRCVASTHIGALKAFPLTRRRAENACVEFDSQTLRPTYHLRIGEPGVSNAIEIAQRLGMPKRLIQAARSHVSTHSAKLNAALAGTIETKRRAEQARSAAEAARLDADRASREARAEREKFQRQQADFHDWVRRVVHLQPGDAVRVRNFDRDGKIVRVRLDQQRAEVDVGSFAVEVPLGDVLPPETTPPPARPAPPQPPPPKTAKKNAPPTTRPRKRATPRRPNDRRRAAQPAPPPPLTDEQIAALAPGDSVFVKRMHRPGRIVRVDQHKRVATVTVGVLEVEVPFDGLAVPSESRPPARKNKLPAIRATPKRSES